MSVRQRLVIIAGSGNNKQARYSPPVLTLLAGLFTQTDASV